MTNVGDEGLGLIDEAECLVLLASQSVGRVAVSVGAVPAVFPVNFGVLDNTIVFRTAAGTKLDVATRNSVIAFEVDKIDPVYHEGWSVLVVGMAEELTDPATLQRALDLPLAPWAPGSRDHVVCVRPELVSGRRIVHRAVPEAAAS